MGGNSGCHALQIDPGQLRHGHLTLNLLLVVVARTIGPDANVIFVKDALDLNRTAFSGDQPIRANTRCDRNRS